MAKFAIALRGLAGAGVLLLAQLAAAQEFPSGQVRIIVPLPTGGSSDFVARLLANHLGERWKQTVIVENRAGANGMIGMTAAARAKPDGLTLLFAVPSVATVHALIKDPGIDPQKELDGVSQVMESVYVVGINAAVPAKSLGEFIAHARANPGKMNAGIYAAGTRLVTEHFAALAQIKLTHVAYRGESLATAALAAGEVQFVIGSAVTMKERAAQGSVRIVAVSGGKRIPALPDVPSSVEAGMQGFDSVFWFGVLAPAGTPAAIKTQVSQEIASFVRRPDVREKLENFGFSGKASTPDEYQQFLVRDARKWVNVAKAAGIEPQAP